MTGFDTKPNENNYDILSNEPEEQLYTVPFSEIVPTADMKHGMIGCIVYDRGKSRAYRTVRMYLSEIAKRYQLGDGYNLYNPPLILKCKSVNEKKVLAEHLEREKDESPYDIYDRHVENILKDEENVHISKISEIEHSNIGAGQPDHKSRDRGYFRESVYHFAGDPEEWIDSEHHREIIKQSWKMDDLGIFKKPPKHIR